MAAAQNQPTPAPGGDSKKLTTVLVPVAGVAFIVVLVIVIAATSDSPTPTSKNSKGGGGGKEGVRDRRERPSDLNKLSDGTAPQADDPGLKDLGNGLMSRDLKEGDGPVVKRGDKVLVDYIGWRHSDGFMFDSSWKPGGTPFEADLRGGVIEGWLEGVPGMKVGGIRKLVIPPELAYKQRGAGKDIPPNATLVFEIEVLGITR